MRLIITLFVLLGSLSLSAQSLSGNLRSQSTDDVLGYGNVDIFQGDKLIASLLTDKLGNFNVALDTGSYRCVINYADHLPITKEIRVESDEVADFKMAIDPTKPVSPIAVLEKREDDEEMRIEAVEIKRMPARSIADIDGYHRSDSRAPRRSKSSSSGWESKAYSISGAPSMDYEGGGKIGGESARSGALTAGEINDYSKWEMWQDLSGSELKSYADAWKIARGDGKFSRS